MRAWERKARAHQRWLAIYGVGAMLCTWVGKLPSDQLVPVLVTFFATSELIQAMRDVNRVIDAEGGQ